jgi:hypothetical protein
MEGGCGEYRRGGDLEVGWPQKDLSTTMLQVIESETSIDIFFTGPPSDMANTTIFTITDSHIARPLPQTR